MSRSRSDAEVLARMKRDREAAQEEDPFLEKNYRCLTLEERKILWDRRFYIHIRSCAGWVEDEFYMFNPENYQQWKKLDPEIDEVLEYAIASLDALYVADGELIEDLNRRLGRSQKVAQ